MTTEAKTQYAQYVFWRLEPSFHALESNERIVAKQNFLGTFESYQRRALVVSYQATGLRLDCDILCLRVADSLELLQDMTCRLQSSGMGKFLVPAYSYLTQVSGVRYVDKAAGGSDFVPGQAKYLFLTTWMRAGEAKGPPAAQREAMDKKLRDAASKRGIRLHPGLKAGFDELEELVAAETDKPEEYSAFAAEMREIRGESYAFAGPAFACILKDIRDQVDCLG